MRLIDADELLTRIRLNYNNHQNVSANSIKDIIDTTKTAYNVDAVVEELRKEKTICFLTDANTGNEVSDLVYRRVYSALDKAIEIVKGGGKE